MKTLKIVFLLLFSFNYSYAQFGELGSTINQIKSEYSKDFKEIQINVFKDERRYSMFAKNDNYSFLYYANYDSLVYESIAVPLNNESLNIIKENIKKYCKNISEFVYTYNDVIIEECHPDENDPLKKFTVYYKYYFPKEKYRYY